MGWVQAETRNTTGMGVYVPKGKLDKHGVYCYVDTKRTALRGSLPVKYFSIKEPFHCTVVSTLVTLLCNSLYCSNFIYF